MTYNEYTVDVNYYTYWLSRFKANFLDHYTDVEDTEEYYDSVISADGRTAAEVMTDISDEAIKNFLVSEYLCDVYGLKLPASVRDRLRASTLTERHARALLKLKSELMQLRAVQEISDKGLNVAKSEALIDAMIAEKPASPQANIRLLLRSRRLFINTVMDTVKQLNSAGLNCFSRVEESADSVSIILTLDRASSAAAEQHS
jgi:ParB-like chromosome segregation protein Spo0J